MTHTPGPWVVSDKVARIGNDQFITIIAPATRWVAHVLEGTTDAEADAHLIAAAPELLEASRKLLDAVNDLRAFEHHQPNNTGKEWEKLRMARDLAEDELASVIAKAEGR